MTITDIETLLPFGRTRSWIVREGGPDVTEAEVCLLAVTDLLADLDTRAARVGVLWSSSSSGSDAYARVLERLGHPRKRVIAAAGPLSGANADAALISTRFAFTGPSVSVFGPWTEHHDWLAHHYVDSGRADVMVVGFCVARDDRVVAGVTGVVGHGREGVAGD
ncbi:hypothetical protein OG203_43165 [Nocardia sp. NBC_01499]|uniref:hypothetical protein n=1 Tax=Nocardia sp. NBC_01499 TaxID=2903597 RepID=UPI00386ACC10